MRERERYSVVRVRIMRGCERERMIPKREEKKKKKIKRKEDPSGKRRKQELKYRNSARSREDPQERQRDGYNTVPYWGPLEGGMTIPPDDIHGI